MLCAYAPVQGMMRSDAHAAVQQTGAQEGRGDHPESHELRAAVYDRQGQRPELPGKGRSQRPHAGCKHVPKAVDRADVLQRRRDVHQDHTAWHTGMVSLPEFQRDFLSAWFLLLKAANVHEQLHEQR